MIQEITLIQILQKSIDLGWKGGTLIKLKIMLTRNNIVNLMGHLYIPSANANKRFSLLKREISKIERYLTHTGFIQCPSKSITSFDDNFSALNIPSDHPSRDDHDTLHIDKQFILPTHGTTFSIQNIEKYNKLFVISRCYRNEKSARHLRSFHQIDLLDQTEKNDIYKLHMMVLNFLCNFMSERKIRWVLRRSYFPFTVFSAEIDLLVRNKMTEILGCGILNIKKKSDYPILAAGMGIERLIISKYQILYERKIRIDRLAFLTL